MAENSVDVLKENVQTYAFNPSAIQEGVMNLLEEVSNGTVTVVDPTSPFVFAIESAACMTSGFLIKNEALTRKQYPRLAQTEEEVYLHMSDKDFAGRFSNPAKTKFGIIFSEEEILRKMVLDADLGIMKLVIPRNTVFTVGNVSFSLQYPVEIRQMAHGGLQIVYDVSKPSPLQALETNEVAWEYRNDRDVRYITIEFDVSQFNIISKVSSLSVATGFVTTIAYDDLFYYARAFHSNADGTWTEINTTHTDQVYDIKKPTVVLKVNQTNKTVMVSVPQIYTVGGVLTRKLRIDVYQTKGELNMMLGDYERNAFSVEWLAFDENDKNEFVAPLGNLQIAVPYSNETVAGGTNGIDLPTLIEQVVNNSDGEISYPITNVHIEALAKKNGYDIIRNVDVLTNRIFLASKDIDPPSDGTTITGITTCIGVVQETMSQMGILSGVKDNGYRVTICSGSLFRNKDGVISHCTKSEYDGIMSLAPDERAPLISSRRYLFNPFHYVLDSTSSKFSFRAYFLDSPNIKSKVFIAENDTTLIQVSTNTYVVSKTDTGYELVILTNSDDAFKAIDDDEIDVQLGYYPPGESERAYLMGELLEKTEEGERYYRFKLNSNFDVNSDDSLIFKNFSMFVEGGRDTGAGLTTEFDIFYTTKSNLGSQWEISDIDLQLAGYLLDTNSKAITQERLKIVFGYKLDNLWKRARTVVTEKTYKKHDLDVMAFYDKDVYEPYGDTGTIFRLNAQGNIEYNIIHRKGDPVRDSNGTHVVKHRVGEVIHDANGLPIEINGRFLTRNVELLLLDGVYLFATNNLNKSYKESVIEILNTWIMREIQSIEDVALERTEIYYYPRKSLGQISCMIQDGIRREISAEQSFAVELYVSSDVYANTVLRKGISDKTIAVILSALQNKRIAVSEIIVLLRAAYGNDVIDVSLSGLGGSQNLPALTILDESARCSIKKKIVALANGELSVVEDVDIRFVRHSSRT